MVPTFSCLTKKECFVDSKSVGTIIFACLVTNGLVLGAAPRRPPATKRTGQVHKLHRAHEHLFQTTPRHWIKNKKGEKKENTFSREFEKNKNLKDKSDDKKFTVVAYLLPPPPVEFKQVYLSGKIFWTLSKKERWDSFFLEFWLRNFISGTFGKLQIHAKSNGVFQGKIINPKI